MDEAAGWMEGVEFPAHKQDLIEAADEAGAPQELIERLQQLGHEQYESRDDLAGELNRAD